MIPIYNYSTISRIFFTIFTETDADSGVDESTQNATSPNKAHNGSSGNTTNSRIPKKTPPATPHHKSRGRSTDDKSFVPRRPVRSKSVPKPFTSFALTAPIMDDTTSPVKKCMYYLFIVLEYFFTAV